MCMRSLASVNLLLQARIEDPKVAGGSKYESLPTDKLLALRDSRKNDLLQGLWKGETGSSALRLVTELVGLQTASTEVVQNAVDDDETGDAESRPTPSRSQVCVCLSMPITELTDAGCLSCCHS